MVNVATVVQSTLHELSPNGLILPHPLAATFSIFHKVHRTWRWLRRVQAYSQNCLKVAAGYGLNFQYGDSLMLRVSAVFVMVATRILECVRQQAKLQNSWKKWVVAFKGKYPMPTKSIWKKKASSTLLSESTVHWLRHHGKKSFERVQLILIRTFKLAKNAVFLSIRIADAVDDAIEAFSLSPSGVNNGLNEFFLNGTQWTNKLVENRELLIEGLLANKKIIDLLLKGIPTIITADQMIKAAEEGLNMVAKVHGRVEKVCTAGDEFLKACASKWGQEFLSSIGLERLIPNETIPSSQLFGKNVTRAIQRHPRIEKMTKRLTLKTPLPSPAKIGGTGRRRSQKKDSVLRTVQDLFKN